MSTTSTALTLTGGTAGVVGLLALVFCPPIGLASLGIMSTTAVVLVARGAD